MASLVLRTALLITFVYCYLSVTSWYQVDPPTHRNGLIPPLHHNADARTLTKSRGDCRSFWNGKDAGAERGDTNTTVPIVGEREPDGIKQPDSNHSTCSWPTTSDELESSVKTFLLAKTDLFSASCVLVNALTVLDIVLSRRTKPWRFFLRILYRISRSNLKWAVFWLIWLISSQLGSQYLIDQLGSLVRRMTLTGTGLQIQRAWITMQSYPILSALSFFLYNLIAGWFLRRFMPRTDHPHASHDGRSGVQNGPVASVDGLRADQTRLGFLMDCLFRPVSFGTTPNLTDLDFELDDNMELLIERLALPNLWLTPVVPTDYLKYLPVWKFNGWEKDGSDSPRLHSGSEWSQELADHSLQSLVPNCMLWNPDQPLSHPSGMIPSLECAICLDKYRSRVHVCGLPCGHHFHHDCIMIWLQRDNHHCPICRWPAYRAKSLSSSTGADVSLMPTSAPMLLPSN